MISTARFSPRLLVFWGLILLLVLVLTQSFFPQQLQAAQDRVFSFADQEHVEVDPTKGCDRCLVSPDLCSQFGSRNMDLSVAYEGSGDRIKRALQKSIRGEGIKFGIIGGSLSRGHNCKCTTFHRQVFNWWNETFPHPDNLYVDGSVGARGTNYFKFCHVEHLQPDLDIVLIELSINDYMNEENLRNIESIIRSILSYPSKPAIILTASFSLWHTIAVGIDAHIPVAQYYDVPAINMRHGMFPSITGSDDPVAVIKKYFIWKHDLPDRIDLLHYTDLGHTTMGKMIISVIERQLCFVQRGRPYMPPNLEDFPTPLNSDLTVPKQRLTDHFNMSREAYSPVDKPTCASIDSDRNHLRPSENHGWEEWAQPNTQKKFLRSSEPGQRVSFEVELITGQIVMYFLRSKTMKLGLCRCWLDGDENNGKILDGYHDAPTNVGVMEAITDPKKPPAPGKHTITCENLKNFRSHEAEGRGEIFLFIAVMTI